MRVTIADVKRRLNELDGEDGEPIAVIFEARCTNELSVEGELIRKFKIVFYPDGEGRYHTEYEDLFESDNKLNKGDKDNEE